MNTWSLSNVKEVLAFPFKDPRWLTKFLIALLVMLAGFIVPILPGFLLVGYAARITRRITNGDGVAALPEWDNWGDMFMDGLRLSVARFIYSLPVILLLIVSMGFIFVPTMMMGAMDDPNFDGGAAMFMMLSYFVSIGIMVFLGSLLELFVAPMSAHVVASRKLGAAFEFKTWWSILKANLAGFVLVFVIVLGIGQIAGLISTGMIYTCCLICLAPIVIPAVSFYTSAVTAAINGKAYREGAELAGVVIGPDVVVSVDEPEVPAITAE
ncbi:MAG: DUF4013 domain-containing protein [Chloroflexi bacterium]|nr:DUF4013 domain-containing protein [Chloroflexota bacterium]